MALQAEGKSLRQIASILHVGKDTVRTALVNATMYARAVLTPRDPD